MHDAIFPEKRKPASQEAERNHERVGRTEPDTGLRSAIPKEALAGSEISADQVFGVGDHSMPS